MAIQKKSTTKKSAVKAKPKPMAKAKPKIIKVKPTIVKPSKEKEVGIIAGYYSHIDVAIVKVTGEIKRGDKIHIKGHTTDFEQLADSMQIDRKDINKAKKGDDIGLKVIDKVRDNDRVYLMQ